MRVNVTAKLRSCFMVQQWQTNKEIGPQKMGELLSIYKCPATDTVTGKTTAIRGDGKCRKHNRSAQGVCMVSPPPEEKVKRGIRGWGHSDDETICTKASIKTMMESEGKEAKPKKGVENDF